MEDKIIPFGKNKGQPIEILQNDPKYVDWLKAQDWVKQKHPVFYNVIINNLQEPTETPEHNKLQVLFLDENVCLKFAKHYLISKGLKLTYTHRQEIKEPTSLPKKQEDYPNEKPQIFIPNSSSNSIIIPHLKDIDKDIDKYQQPKVYIIPTLHPKKHIETERPKTFEISKAIFEKKGIDVTYTVKTEVGIMCFYIEIKPIVGDDYPAILRQMDNNGTEILIADAFSAVGATLDQVKEIFKRSNKLFYLFNEFL
jgi:hypothetical protein